MSDDWHAFLDQHPALEQVPLRSSSRSLSLSPLLPLASHIYSSSKAHMTSWGQVFALGKVTFSKHSSRTIA